MGYCPVCKTSASQEQPPGADFLLVFCRKCGDFEISGTALSMLESRLAGADSLTVARLSHAIRSASAASGRRMPQITSVNLDEMIAHPLPNVPRQMTNLLTWLAKKLGDDHLGAVELPDENDLTAVIGTIDGERVDALINRVEQEGLIEYVPEHFYRITNTGWQRLEPSPAAATTIPPEPMPGKEVPPVMGDNGQPKVTKANCNTCGGERNAWVRSTYTDAGSDGVISWSTTYDTLQCCGCDELSVRKQYWFSEWDNVDQDDLGRPILVPGIETTYFPAVTVRKRPVWLDQIKDQILRGVMEELYIALNNNLSVVSSIAARTLLDRAGHTLVGDQGNFANLLKEMETQHYISGQEKRVLEVVADAGNASAHRGYAPKPDHLNGIVDIMETFIFRSIVLSGAADEVEKATPPRPKRPPP